MIPTPEQPEIKPTDAAAIDKHKAEIRKIARRLPSLETEIDHYTHLRQELITKAAAHRQAISDLVWADVPHITLGVFQES